MQEIEVAEAALLRTDGSAGMCTGAMWQRHLRDMNVLMTHNTVQASSRRTPTAGCTSGSLPHRAETLVPQAR